MDETRRKSTCNGRAHHGAATTSVAKRNALARSMNCPLTTALKQYQRNSDAVLAALRLPPGMMRQQGIDRKCNRAVADARSTKPPTSQQGSMCAICGALLSHQSNDNAITMPNCRALQDASDLRARRYRCATATTDARTPNGTSIKPITKVRISARSRRSILQNE